MLRLIGGEPLVRGGQHIGMILAPDRDRQERWMTSALPDGRVPMDVLLDEEDEELFAEWDAADGDALAATRALLDRVGDRPLPPEELSRVGARLRQGIARPGWPGRLLIECSGLHPEDLPADDERLTALGWWGMPGAMLQV